MRPPLGPAAPGRRFERADPFADGDADGGSAKDVSAGVGSVPIDAFRIGAH